ncbi:hypothetical protein ACRRTK_019311 [Alexandromys fortis]
MQPPPGMALPWAVVAPPPYELLGHPVPQPGFVPPHMNSESTYMPVSFCPPPGPHPPVGYYPSGSYCGHGGRTVTVLVLSRAAPTLMVLQGEIFEGAPLQCAPTASRQSSPTSPMRLT